MQSRKIRRLPCPPHIIAVVLLTLATAPLVHFICPSATKHWLFRRKRVPFIGIVRAKWGVDIVATGCDYHDSWWSANFPAHTTNSTTHFNISLPYGACSKHGDNTGWESSAYLDYIVERYSAMTYSAVFLHESRHEEVDEVQLARLSRADLGYREYDTISGPGLRISQEEFAEAKAFWEEHMEQFVGPFPCPNGLAVPPQNSFAVATHHIGRRNIVTHHAWSAWRELLEREPSKMRIFRNFWHILLGRECLFPDIDAHDASRAANAPRSLKPDHNRLVQFHFQKCQDTGFSFSDLTVLIVSSINTFNSRFPPIDKTWVGDMERRGARIVVFVGPGDLGNVTDSRVVRTPRDIGVGGCYARVANCDPIFRHQVKWLRDNVKTKYIAHADDDTVVHVERYKEAMSCLPGPDEPFMFGSCGFLDGTLPRFCTGGAMYTLPTWLLDDFRTCRAGYLLPEDVYFSWCAVTMGAVLVNHPKASFDPVMPEGWLSSHHVQPEQVPQYYANEHEAAEAQA